MTRRTHAAERVVETPFDDRIGGRDRGARRAQCRAIGFLTRRRVRIEFAAAMCSGRAALDVVDMRLRMHAREFGFVGERRFLALDQAVDAARDQLILDRQQARRTFGMPLAVIVLIGIGVEAGSHYVSQCRWRIGSRLEFFRHTRPRAAHLTLSYHTVSGRPPRPASAVRARGIGYTVPTPDVRQAHVPGHCRLLRSVENRYTSLQLTGV